MEIVLFPREFFQTVPVGAEFFEFFFRNLYGVFIIYLLLLLHDNGFNIVVPVYKIIGIEKYYPDNKKQRYQQVFIFKNHK